MMLKRSTPVLKPAKKEPVRLVRAGLVGLAALTAVTALATGCLDRPVKADDPITSNVFVSQIVQTSVDKIDLLFMVDNSVSMADKQEILKEAVPVLVNRLIQPLCVDGMGNPTSGSATNGVCANGQPEFPPINDIHIGIVSSSLGAHGGEVCAAPDSAIGTPDDKGELIGSRREPNWSGSASATLDFDSATKSWNNSGFLAWDPNQNKNTPPGEKDSGTFVQHFEDMIVATGEHGCGFEASLEAWYRFLVDPAPPASVTKVGNATVRSSDVDPTAVDKVLLAQRAAFLRPDSLVAIVMMSDENDCSIVDNGVGWFVGALRHTCGGVSVPQHMPRGTSACLANPNDHCCRSCAQDESQSGPPQGCGAVSSDTECTKDDGKCGDVGTLFGAGEDNTNLRCYNQHQRFGFDLLYPTARYVQGLTQATLPSAAAPNDPTKNVPNPLYVAAAGKTRRDPSLVFLAGIVGVPWQDLATAETLKDPNSLKYLTAKEMRDKGVWPLLLGDPANPAGPVPPTDPFMRETTEPRSGMNPVTMDPIVPPTSNNPTASPINGHEQNIPDKGDLQYACTFKLGKERVCPTGDSACDCSPDKGSMPPTLNAVTASNSPLCQPPGGGGVSATQYYAKAYPGARELTVLHDLVDQGIVASICPKISDPAQNGNPSYGYNPAVGAIIDRLKDALKGKCLPRPLEQTSPGGPVECKVIEAVVGSSCDCTLEGRAPAVASILPAVQRQLQATGVCGTGSLPACDSICTCEITQLEGDQGNACKSGNASPAGYCYVNDPASQFLKNCPANQKQLLRFVDTSTGQKTPVQGAIGFIACLGAAVGADVTPIGGSAGM